MKLINQFHLNDANFMNPTEASACPTQKTVSQFKSQLDYPVSA